ncbi:MAG: winged helix-turn-helix domain-containing protein [Acidobacteria bacterium]|nr:winged helix-turn-helix domain-containing protein [Acidobacteriota bacterium]
MPAPVKHIFLFGPFHLDIRERLLLRDGEIVSLTRKAFETLALLVQNSGHVLQKEEMMNIIWPDSFVEEATLAQNVFTLRRVLGESPMQTQYIETVPRLGYRFIAKVSQLQSDYPVETDRQNGTSPTAIKSIAILPFKTLTVESDSEYFGLGMADALITRLSNVKNIMVRPTSAILKYHRQEQELFTVGHELKVELVMDGIIQQMDDRIRITVQLVNVETGAPLWADKFDEKFSDVFTVQDIISEKVIEALTLKLTSSQKMLLTKRHTKNSEAYRYYLKGHYLWSKWTEDGFKKSIAAFEQAIKLEPDYALAYAGMADTYISLGFYGYLSPSKAMPQAKLLARKALLLDDQLAEARLSLAAALFFYDWDWAGAEEEFKRCIEANPSYAIAHQSYGLYLIAMKRFEEASAVLHQAAEADPISPLIKTTAGFPYYYSGQPDIAIKHYRETLEEEPYFGLAHLALADVYIQKMMYEEAIHHYKEAMAIWGEKQALPYLGYVYALSNKRDEALRILKKLEQMSAQEHISPLAMAMVYIGLGDNDATFEWLEKAYHERSNKLVFLGVQPLYDSIRTTAPFTSLLKRIGLNPAIVALCLIKEVLLWQANLVF